MSYINKNNRIKRIFLTVSGVVLCGIAAGLFKHACLGIDPFQILISGINAVIPISYGTLYVGVNIVLLCFSYAFGRCYIGIATFINLFFLGYIVEFTQKILLHYFPNLGLGGRSVIMILGILLLCFSSSLYFTADLGVSTYDAIALVMANKWKMAPFKYCRIITDMMCVIIGAVLFGVVHENRRELLDILGVATIITAFFTGPLIAFFNVHVARPFLEGKAPRITST